VHDEKALFDEDDAEEDEIVLGRNEYVPQAPETSKQRLLSMAKAMPEFEGLRTTSSGHKVQDIKELMTVPVIVTADLTKSPPVIKVYSVNPYAKAWFDFPSLPTFFYAPFPFANLMLYKTEMSNRMIYL